MPDRPIEVAVIGGGCAAMATAFELTRKEHQGRYHVTVYQLGWRLGGKGASGRGAHGRIEEHGLHLWLGFYENAFRLLRECYDELGRDPASCRIADWTDGFFPDPAVGMVDRDPDGSWVPWWAHFPVAAGLPGDPLSETNPFTVQAYVSRSISLLGVLFSSARSHAPEGEPSHELGSSNGESHGSSSQTVAEVVEAILRLTRFGQLATVTALVEATRLLEAGLRLAGFPRRLGLELIESIGRGARTVLDQLIDGDRELRRVWEMVDLILAYLRGAFRFNLLADPRGFSAIDGYDCREWLRLNGASERALDSAFVRSLYDFVFAYEEGDPKRPRIAAGQGMRGMMRMFFTCRGALFWKMTAGMGDVVFAPFYEVLQRRGVDFRFFHRLANVRLASEESLAPGDKPYVEALELEVQAETATGEPYEPLIDVEGLPCWPAGPLYSQLADGDRLESEAWDPESHWDSRVVANKTLEVTRDFDFVVLGVGVGAVPHVASELIEREPRWARMVEETKTVATQAFQLWLDAETKELGWHGSPVNLCGFVEPFDTWADMSHLATEESWPEAPRSIAYFCNVLPEGPPPPADVSGYPQQQRERVRANAVRFLDRDIGHLWPLAVTEDGFRYELLADGSVEGERPVLRGAERFETQFWTANINPSDRYALSLPGSLEHRISPLDGTFDNLTIAGDWTDCGHNAGCVEAAVMSGRLAAHAISRNPPLEDIVGFDHP